MTSDKRSQEAEDVALDNLIDRAVTDLYLSIPASVSDRNYRFDRAARPILARLVREGHIRELEALAKRQCWLCTAENPQTHRDEGLCSSTLIHARIAALRQEG